MEWKLGEAYLRPFKHQTWNVAIQDREVLRFLKEYFSESLYWHPTFPTIASDVVLGPLVAKFKRLNPLSKLDIYLCFPYFEYHKKSVFTNSITKLAHALFDNNDSYVLRLIRECRLVLLNSNTDEGLIRLKSKHIDLICATYDKTDNLPSVYIDAVNKVKSGLHHLFKQVKLDRDQQSLVKRINESQAENARKAKNADLPEYIDRNKIFNKTDSILNILKKANFPKTKKEQQQIAEETKQNDIGIARIQEIMKLEEEKYKQSLSGGQLSYPYLDEPGWGGVSFDELMPKEPDEPKPQKPKRKRATPMRRSEPKETRKFGNLEVLNLTEVQQPPFDNVIVSTVSPNPSSPDSARNEVTVPKPSEKEYLEQHVIPGINAPISVRMTSGEYAVMQPNPKIQVFMRQKDMAEKYTSVLMKRPKSIGQEPQQQFKKPIKLTILNEANGGTINGTNKNVGGRVIPLRIIEEDQKQQVPQRLKQNHSSSVLRRNRRQSYNYSPKKPDDPVNGTLIPVNKKTLAKHKLITPPMFFHATYMPETSTPEKKVFTIQKIEPTKTNPRSQTLAFTGEPTLKQVALATMMPRTRRRSSGSEKFFLTGDILQSAMMETCSNNMQSSSGSIAMAQMHVPKAEPMDYQQQLDTVKEEPNPDFYDLDLTEVVDHEEIVTTSEEELFKLLEQTEKEEEAEQEEQNRLSVESNEELLLERMDYAEVVDQQFFNKNKSIPMYEEEEGTVELEEIDGDDLLFEDPKADDILYSAEEVENILTPKELEVYNPNEVTVEEYAELEAEYPDIFLSSKLNDNIRLMMAAFMLGRQENPNPSITHMYTAKVKEMVQSWNPKRTVELFFEMDFNTNEWKRYQKVQTFREDGIHEVIDYLDGPQNRTEVMHRYNNNTYFG